MPIMPPRFCCCGLDCEECNDIDTVFVGGLDSDGACELAGCENKNGTYLFRSIGTGGPCSWTFHLGIAQTCFHSCNPEAEGFIYHDPNWMVGGGSSGCFPTTGPVCLIEFLDDPGGVKVRVTISYTYNLRACSDGTASDTSSSGYTAVWEKVFADCASISGALDLVDTDVSGGCVGGPPHPTGDLCGLFGATVSVG